MRAPLQGTAPPGLQAEVNGLLGAAGIPVAPIRNVKEALESEHAAHRGLLTEVREPDGGTVRLPSQPVKFSGYGANRVTPAPALRQHTEAILGELGIASAQAGQLWASGALGAAAMAAETLQTHIFNTEKQHA
ncbi:CoA transferase [Cupriavidus necator]|nr:CoA transferase [Cupriavidus necator]WKA42761.1 CoA transferase [Cupriavidus necator]